VSSARRFVTACRASGQRREEFEKIIRDGNVSGGWGVNNEPLRVVGLLKDVDTRWSSTFSMIDRFLEMYPVHVCDIQVLATVYIFVGNKDND